MLEETENSTPGGVSQKQGRHVSKCLHKGKQVVFKQYMKNQLNILTSVIYYSIIITQKHLWGTMRHFHVQINFKSYFSSIACYLFLKGVLELNWEAVRTVYNLLSAELGKTCMLLNSKDTDTMFWYKCHLSLQKQNVKTGPNSEM